ncbi:phage tail assembly chaperone [Delftia sp. JD2]|uniref:phage tail assembly chaperone n=1 Tax=Delftia sp. JD2 TaxID=469553 RepID=UPI0009FFCE27
MPSLSSLARSRVAACDWVTLRAQETGDPVPEAWRAYRQALRDISSPMPTSNPRPPAAQGRAPSWAPACPLRPCSSDAGRRHWPCFSLWRIPARSFNTARTSSAISCS